MDVSSMDPLELEFVSHLTWILGTEWGSSARAVRYIVLTAALSLGVFFFIFLMEIQTKKQILCHESGRGS